MEKIMQLGEKKNATIKCEMETKKCWGSEAKRENTVSNYLRDSWSKLQSISLESWSFSIALLSGYIYLGTSDAGTPFIYFLNDWLSAFIKAIPALTTALTKALSDSLYLIIFFFLFRFDFISQEKLAFFPLPYEIFIVNDKSTSSF